MDILNSVEGKLAVSIARNALEKLFWESEGTHENLPPVFEQLRGVFVTLKREGALRGCIGYPYPILPLREALEKAAVAAALDDPRFLPVGPEELDCITIEVTVLTQPEPLNCPVGDIPGKIKVGRHGIIISGQNTSGLLLPQVPVEWEWDARTFLDQTCIKAGLYPDCWKSSDIRVLTFEGQIFSE
jgi:uncharacterized protein (TIGR00296 family)